MNQPSPERPSDIAPPLDQLAATKRLPADDPSSQLVRVLDQYLEDLQAGRSVNRERLLAEHPDLASQLADCLAGIEFIHRAAAPAMSLTPTRLGDYRVVREIGRGGMGVVYEAETVAGLHHTNIVPIFAIGCENGVNYYAMQFIEGQSLANVAESLRDSDSCHGVPQRHRAATQIANWGLQAAEALAHAHQRGVIHRDIKPSNLILDPDGRIWLTDVGLAKRIDDVSLSMAGAILGTPRYMSPEQAAATKQPVDHRTDIYSLGATFYELATRRPLFEANSPELVISQILNVEPVSPRRVQPGLPRDVETILLKCLAKEMSRRYATAQALADDLRAFNEKRPIQARRVPVTERISRWCEKHRTHAAAIVQRQAAQGTQPPKLAVWVGRSVYGLTPSTGQPFWRCDVDWSPHDENDVHLQLLPGDQPDLPRLICRRRFWPPDQRRTVVLQPIRLEP